MIYHWSFRMSQADVCNRYQRIFKKSLIRATVWRIQHRVIYRQITENVPPCFAPIQGIREKQWQYTKQGRLVNRLADNVFEVERVNGCP